MSRLLFPVAFLVLSLFASIALAQDQTSSDTIKWGLPADPNANVPASTPSQTMPPSLSQANIRLFKGTARACRQMLGGVQQCCTANVPDNQTEWWKTYNEAARQNAAAASACSAGDTAGAWSNMASGQADHSTLQSSFTSKSEYLAGGGQKIGCGGEDTMASVQATFMSSQQAQKTSLDWVCNDQEYKLAVQKKAGECHLIGTKCNTKILGVCVEKAEVYCCFNSPVSRVLREAMAKQSTASFGTPKAPQCDGITLQQLQSTNLDATTDYGEIVGRMAAGNALPNPTDASSAENKLTGSGSDIQNQGRQTLTARTLARSNQVNAEGTDTTLTADMSQALPTSPVATATGPGQISFTSGYMRIDNVPEQNGVIALSVTRNGGVGAVSVDVQFFAGSNATFVTLTWASGETGNKLAKFQISMGGTQMAGTEAYLVNSTPGVTLTPYSTMDIDLYGASSTR